MNRKLFTRALTVLALALVSSAPTFASATGGLPWEHPLSLIAQSLTGPVAYSLGLIGIGVAGGTLLWGHELGEFGRKATMLALVVSVLVFASPMLSSAFGISASLV